MWLNLHGCEQSCGAKTITSLRRSDCNLVIIFDGGIVKNLQTIGHGEQVTLHFILVQVIVVDFVRVSQVAGTMIFDPVL